MQPKTTSRFHEYICFLAETSALTFDNYASLHQWSIDNQAAFWKSIATFFNVDFDSPYREVYVPAVPFWKTKWFTDSHLSYAHHVFRNGGSKHPAIIYQNETNPCVEISWQKLLAKTYAIQQQLMAVGVGSGDTVVCYGINSPETVAAFLAVNALGAVWSSCSPDFGTDAVCERFEQLHPKAMFAHQHYTYGGKAFDTSTKVKAIQAKVLSLQAVLWLDEHTHFDDKTVAVDQLVFTPVSFSAPIWTLFSSGTTGKPKAIVHGTGHMLLEHLKALTLHQDVREGDRYFWYSTTGWMMWNYALGSLLCGATLCLYSGAPTYPTQDSLWRFANNAKINHFGGGAVYFKNQMASPIPYVKQHDFSFMRTIGATGSPLSVAVCSDLQRQFPSAHIISLSGGTDVCTAFVGGHPELEVVPGEIQCKMLGAAIEVWNDNGTACVDTPGELVLTQPFLSMPLYLVNDPDFLRYASSYFNRYKTVWNHGDWAAVTNRGGIIIYGRSDATLNRFGVRIGTSEIYTALSKLNEIEDALVVHVQDAQTDTLLLFVQASTKLDHIKIKQHIRKTCSPRHVPDTVCVTPEIPYTISGKKVEIPVKRILQGTPLAVALSLDALRNPNSMLWFVEFAKRFKSRQ